MGKLVSLWLVVLSLLFVPLQARSQSFAARAPWAPGPPDACSALAVPCAQIDDFNLALRVSASGFWGAPGEDGAAPPAWVAGGGGTLGATLSFYKTAEFGLALPFAYLRAPGQTWIYGPPEVRLRWRMGPRMGPGPFGAPWPADESYPKALPASYDVQPARWTAAIGFRFRPLWPGFAGTGPRLCRASESSCLAEVGLQASLDLRAWRLLLTSHAEAVAAGDQSHLVLGGRVAADVAGVASLFSEAVLRQGIADPSQRAGLLLVGAGLRGFRGAHLQAFYGRSFGGLSGDHLGGVALQAPVGLFWGALQALSAAVDPFFARDGWIYDDRCAPLFELSRPRAAAAGIAEGAHLWRSGDMLYFDQACQQPAVAVEAGRGAPVPIRGVATPWPDAAAARRYGVERERWLRRFAEAPDPERRELCEELVAQTLTAMARAARAQRLQTQCAEAQRQKAGALANAYSSGALEHGTAATVIGTQIWEAIACDKQMSAQTLASAAMVLRPGGGAISLAGRPPQPAPAGVASHAPPTGAGGAPPAGPAAATHAPPPAAAPATTAAPGPAPGRRAGPQEVPIPPQWFPPTPPARQLPPGPPRVPTARQLPSGPQPRAQLAPPTRPPPVSYEHLPPPKRVAPAKDFTNMQRKKMLKENDRRNGGLKDDRDGTPLVYPKRHQKGVCPPDNEANIDHVVSKNKGGTNDYSNGRVRARKANIEKSDKDPTPEDF